MIQKRPSLTLNSISTQTLITKMNFPSVNPTDFHMTNYPSSIYSEIEQFCEENEFTVDYFLSEFAQETEKLQRPFNAYRGRSPLNDA